MLKCGLADHRGDVPSCRLSGSLGSGAALVEDAFVSFLRMMDVHGELPRRMQNIWFCNVMQTNI
jgi:hypothetical protein